MSAASLLDTREDTERGAKRRREDVEQDGEGASQNGAEDSGGGDASAPSPAELAHAANARHDTASTRCPHVLHGQRLLGTNLIRGKSEKHSNGVKLCKRSSRTSAIIVSTERARIAFAIKAVAIRAVEPMVEPLCTLPQA